MAIKDNRVVHKNGDPISTIMCLMPVCVFAYLIMDNAIPNRVGWWILNCVLGALIVFFVYLSVIMWLYKFDFGKHAFRQRLGWSTTIVRYRDVVRVDDITQNFHIAVWYLPKGKKIKVPAPIGTRHKELSWLLATLRWHADRNQGQSRERPPK